MNPTTILLSFAALAIVTTLALVIKTARQARRDAEFEVQEAERRYQANEDKQRRRRELMLKEYHAPVPKENVPGFENNPVLPPS